MTPAPVDLSAARSALLELTRTLPALLEAVSDPSRPAVGQWSIAETAAHLTHAWGGILPLARADLDAVRASLPFPIAVPMGTPSGSLLSRAADLDPFTVALVSADPERDLGILGRRISERAGEVTETFTGDPAVGLRPWMLDGIHVPQSHFACHLLNESLVHSLDIAKAAGVAATIRPEHAVLVLRGFLFPMMEFVSRPVGTPPGDPGPGPVIEVRLRGTSGRNRIHLGANEICVDGPADRPVDARLSVEPVAMLELIWSRRSPAALVAAGKLMLWGRRPWVVLELMKRATPEVALKSVS